LTTLFRFFRHPKLDKSESQKVGTFLDNLNTFLFSPSPILKIGKSKNRIFLPQPQIFFSPTAYSKNRESGNQKIGISSTTTTFLFSDCRFRKLGNWKIRYFFHNQNFSFLRLPIPKIGNQEIRKSVFLPQPQLFFSPTADSENWEIGKSDISSITKTFLFSDCLFQKLGNRKIRYFFHNHNFSFLQLSIPKIGNQEIGKSDIGNQTFLYHNHKILPIAEACLSSQLYLSQELDQTTLVDREAQSNDCHSSGLIVNNSEKSGIGESVLAPYRPHLAFLPIF